MGNTKRDILKILLAQCGLTAEAIAIRQWPTTKQLEKKTNTARTHLRTLIRERSVVCDAEKYSITPRGIKALADAEQELEIWRRRCEADRAAELLANPAHLRRAVEKPVERNKLTPGDFGGFPRIAQ